MNVSTMLNGFGLRIVFRLDDLFINQKSILLELKQSKHFEAGGHT